MNKKELCHALEEAGYPRTDFNTLMGRVRELIGDLKIQESTLEELNSVLKPLPWNTLLSEARNLKRSWDLRGEHIEKMDAAHREEIKSLELRLEGSADHIAVLNASHGKEISRLKGMIEDLQDRPPIHVHSSDDCPQHAARIEQLEGWVESVRVACKEAGGEEGAVITDFIRELSERANRAEEALLKTCPPRIINVPNRKIQSVTMPNGNPTVAGLRIKQLENELETARARVEALREHTTENHEAIDLKDQVIAELEDRLENSVRIELHREVIEGRDRYIEAIKNDRAEQRRHIEAIEAENVELTNQLAQQMRDFNYAKNSLIEHLEQTSLYHTKCAENGDKIISDLKGVGQ